MSKYKKLLKDKKLMSGIYAVTLVTALLVLALAVRGPEKSGKLIADSSGSLIGIERSSLKRSERYDLSIEVGTGEDAAERDVTLTLQAVEGAGAQVRSSRTDVREAELEAAIDNMISTVEYSKKRKIRLPAELPDGTPVRWTGSARGNGTVPAVIVLMYLSLIALMIANAVKGDGTAADERRAILRGLPRFCNQLYLMMNAGLILSDAFNTISDGYSSAGGSLSPFERDIAGLREAAEGQRVSTAQAISDYAVRHDVKELVRIAAILTENERRGSDVIENLERESRYLWDERKTVARECGKGIDTKMSYPLGALLIVLIVITMAPALLNM